MAENILANYKHDITYINTEENTIGATTSTTLRTITTFNDANCIHVKKFGSDYAITDITNAVISNPRSDGGGVNQWRFNFYGWDGTTWTLMARVTDANGASAFTDVAAFSASKVRIELELLAGTISITDGDDIALTTDVDAPLTVYLSGEDNDMDGYYWYLSSSGSTYYDEDYKYGGYRHTEDGTLKYPYFKIQDGIDNTDSYHYIVTVLDSESYDEDIDLTLANLILQTALGQTATITRGIGARITREVIHDGNNSDTKYVGKSGNDANPGTYQEPYLTIQFAENNMGGLSYLNIMDSNTYSEQVDIDSAITIEPIYGHIPVINTLSSVNYLFIISVAGCNIYGLYFDGNGLSLACVSNNDNNTYTGTIADNTATNPTSTCLNLSDVFQGNILRNLCSVGNGIYVTDDAGAAVAGTIDSNICFNTLGTGIWVSGGTVANATTTISNNLCYNCDTYGIWINLAGNDYTGTCENNTMTQNGTGLYAGSTAGVFRNLISYNNTTYDLSEESGTVTVTETNYGTNDNCTIGVGCITTDPEFCKITLSYRFGISANSGAYRTDTNSDDMGTHFRIIEINNDNIEINGFNIDGQNFYNNAIFIVDSADHTDANIKWCSVYDFQGIAIDLYDDDTDTDAVIENCKIYNNGNGIKLAYGGNTIEECLIYNNIIFGIWLDYTGQIMNHNVFYNNQYGIYIESNASVLIKNSIFFKNSLYAIYSELSITVTYCCITDAIYNVDNTDSSNFTDNPLFVNINSGEEDFNIKTIEAGYSFDSPCKDSADDGYDVGAYLITRIVDEDDWKKYEFEFNPHVEWTNIIEGYSQFVDALAGKDNFGKDSKRMFVFDFGKDQQVSSETIRQKMEYFATLIKTRANGLTEEQTKFRIHFQPTSYLVAKASAVITTADNNIFDSGKSWIENQWKGFHAGVLYTSGVGSGTIDPVGKTLTIAPDPSWTNDEWIGYYFYYNGYYYYILDNDSDSLTLSDPNETLTVQAGIDWTIEKYFKIISNSENTLCVSDDDDELVAGTYTYYIDFIECKVFTSSFQYMQPRFLYTREHSKTGYKLIFQEV